MEQLKEQITNENSFENLLTKFNALSDNEVGNSVLTTELFKTGKNGEEAVINRLENGKIEAPFKNDAYFRLAKLCYENNPKNTSKAMEMAEKISNPDERVRCFVQIASQALKANNEVQAEEIISKVDWTEITPTQETYLKFYDDQKSKLKENN